MGYTSYFRQKPVLDQEKFNEFSAVVAKLLNTDEARKLLAYEYNQTNKPPVVSNQEVRFNGKEDDGHETFLFARETKIGNYQKEKGAGMAFNFCKTAQKPYDKYVVACLIIAKSIFGKDVAISSDGDLNDWQVGKGLAEQAMFSTIELNHDGEHFVVESKAKETSVEEFIADITK